MDPFTMDAQPGLPERFRVEARLGRGGGGEVYRAFDAVLERTVAVKVVQPGKANRQACERLLREARACARLAHPNIVTIHDVLQLKSGVCIVMEHLEGGSLESGNGSRTLEERIGILIRILDGLRYAHDRGVVHRDVKPRNVQVLPDGSIKLLDFGIAHTAGAETLTGSGTITGSVHYASPEQLRGENTDARTDVYSAGILAYELFTGRRPFDGDTIGAVVTQVLHKPLPDMAGEWSETVPEADEIVRTATAKNAGDRYASAGEMRDAWNDALAGLRDGDGPTEAQPWRGRGPSDGIHTEETGALEQSRAKPAWRRRRTAVAATIAAAVVGGVAWTAAWRSTGAPEGRPAPVEARTSDVLLPTTATAAPREDAPEAAEASTERVPGTAGAGSLETVDIDTPRRADTTGDGRPTEVATTASASDDARVLYYAARGEAERDRSAGTGSKSGIRYRVLRREPGGAALEVDPDTTFRSGERIRFGFEPNIDGFLYVVQRGSTGQWSVLLPHPQINDGRNAVTEFEEVTIPPRGWFRFDDNPGNEQVFVYLSREPIEELPGGTGRVVRAHSADEHTVKVLAGSVRSRDLVFEKETRPGAPEQAAYVVNHGRAGGAVAWTVELEHR